MNNKTTTTKHAPQVQTIAILATIAILTMIATLIYAVSYQSQRPRNVLDSPNKGTSLEAPVMTSTAHLNTAESTLDSVDLENNHEIDQLDLEANKF